MREKSGLTQEELAFEAGLERTAIGRLERGERQPTLPTVFALAKALKMRASEMIAQMER